MTDETDISISPEIRKNAEAVMETRFRFARTEHPVLETLFKLGVEKVAKGMVRNPDAYRGTANLQPPLTDQTSDQASGKRTPLELLVNEINLPALPQILIELMRVINDPKSSANELAEVIGLDTSLSSYLLRIVNSAYFSFPFPIDTITRAVTLLGTQELSTLAFSTSFLTMFKKSASPLINLEQFWKHSIACGITARALARQCKKKNPERHFLAGLLHDIGRLTLFSNLPELVGDVLSLRYEKDIILYEAEQIMLGFDHARFGGQLLKKWNFPSTLVAAVFNHHAPHQVENFEEPATVHIADIIANALDMGTSGESAVPPMSVGAWDTLKLSPGDLAPIMEGLESPIEETFSILIGVKDFGTGKK